MHPKLRTLFLLAIASCSIAAPVHAQDDAMTPVGVPAQSGAIALETGPLPGARHAETWHRQYGSVFARNVSVATLTPFLPAPEKATGTAVIVAPGGGFRTLSMQNEGWDVARALAARGIAAFVLKYRLEPTPAGLDAFATDMRERMSGARPAHLLDPSKAVAHLGPQLADARAAFALVRERADDWGIDRDRVGMVGFSAGAMLTLATTLAVEDAKPAFIATVYGPLSALEVPADAPPLFVAIAADDGLFADGGFDLIERWRAARRPVEFHLYERGGHGFGMYPKATTSTGWFAAFVDWMKMHGWLERGPGPGASVVPRSNPLFRDRFTADPAPLVIGDRLYLYVGHDEAQRDEMFNMREWRVYSTTDMADWTDHGPIMKATDFRWAKADAWASQAIEKDGRFWFYAAVEHDGTQPGKAIGVAVSDRPTGPFVDAKGAALITNAMTPAGTHSWEDIDPTVFTDDDGITWIAWGNRQCYIARLKPNMIELDGPITEITPPHFEEGPWLHKRGATYYLTYASLDRATHRDERVSYATATSLPGPWTYRGELTGSGKYSFTIHPGIAEFKGRWYLFLHNAALTVGDQHGAIGRRAVTVEHLQYNPDGSLKPVVQTEAGISVPPSP